MKTKPKPKNHGKKDPVKIQISIQAKVPKGKTVSPALLDEVRARWIETGKCPKGFKVSAVRWLNPKRKDKSLAIWKQRTSRTGMEHARQTLRLRALLASRPDIFHAVGTGKRIR